MLIDLKKIRLEGKTEQDFSFDYKASNEILTIGAFKDDVLVNVTVKIYNDFVNVAGEIAFTLKGNCTRCLTETENTFTLPFDEDFSKDGDDEEEYLYQGETIDLTKAVNDTIIINLPVSFLCSDDCPGLIYNS